MSAEADPMPAPVDLRLRGDPPPVMRLSRKTLVAGGLILASATGGAVVYGLRHAAHPVPVELHEPATRTAADLSAAPKDYATVPRLGPPLPGDLGRPILSAQQRGTDAAPRPLASPAPTPPPRVAPVDPARTRASQERDAARTSRLFLGGEARAGAAPATPPMPPDARLTRGSEEGQSMPAHAGKQDFLGPKAAAPVASRHRLEAQGSDLLLQAGSIIPAALITGIRSDLPGVITAQVTQNVYDSATGRHLLIPQGSRLVGEYDSQVSFGQSRVLLAWNRLILPDGRSLQLDRLPAGDLGGNAGLEDRVEQHWGGMLRAALVSTLLGIGTELGGAGDDALLRAVRRGGSESIGRAGQDLVRKQMNVQPTLTIRPGFQFRVIVTRDLILTDAGER
ncbi:TrbI/VirB10 family protein [Sphingomonas sp. CJ20]